MKDSRRTGAVKVLPKNLVPRQVTKICPFTLTFQVSVRDPVYMTVDVARLRARPDTMPPVPLTFPRA